MKYEDALDEALVTLRNGASPDDLVARYPEHAVRLREDLDTAMLARRAGQSLPAAAPDANRLHGALEAARADREATYATRDRVIFAPPLLFRGAALAAVVIVAAVSFAVVGDRVPFGGSVEAGSIEGVVIENSRGLLTLQTDAGIESVTLAEATVTDATKATVTTAAIEPGQVLEVRGRRIAAGQFDARRVTLRAASELRAWCAAHSGRCPELEQSLRQQLLRCEQAQAPVCPAIRARIDEITSQVGILARIEDMRRRCAEGARAVCQELMRLCNTQAESCRPFAGWLRMQLRD